MTSVNIADAREKIKIYIIDYVKGAGKTLRDDIFEPVLKRLGLSPDEMKNKSGDSDYGRYKSLTGTVINELVRLNVIHYEGKDIVLTEEFDANALREHFLNKYLTEAEKKVKKPQSKVNTLKSILGNTIKRYKSDLKNKTLAESIDYINDKLQESDKFKSFVLDFLKLDSYPFNPLGNRLRKQKETYGDFITGKISEDDYQHELIRAIMESISIAGGEFFERLSLNVIKAAYGDSVISEKLTGGSDDNGIDSELVVRDPMGFYEKIIVQSKTKYNEISSINVKVLREFIGVVTAYRADKGILICNTEFHKLAETLSKKCHSVLLIGKKELFAFMKKFKIGIKYDYNGNPLVDDDTFLIK